MKKKRFNQLIAMLLSLALVFSSEIPYASAAFAEDLVTPTAVTSGPGIEIPSGPAVVTPREVTLGQTYNVVKWDITTGAAVMSIPASGGEETSIPALLTRDSSYTGKPTFSSSSLSTNTWNAGANTKYWQAAFSTKHFRDIKISSSHRSSGTGPRDFKLQYSLDGTTFSDVDGGAFVIGNSQPLTKLLNGVALPEAANDQAIVYVRWLLTSNTSAAGGTSVIASGGASNINNILVTGTELVTNLTPVASIESGTVALNTVLKFSNGDTTSKLVYSLNNSSTFVDYTTASAVVLSTLPMTVKVKAVAQDEESRTKTYTYMQSKVEPIIPNKFSGKILADTLVTLTSASQEAVISYIVTKKEGLPEQTVEASKVYTGPIKITADMFPVKIEAVANIDGWLQSNTTTLNFTEKIVGIQKLYFGQLHSHTAASDGIGTPAEAFAYAKLAPEIDFLAVTDHSNYLDKSSALGKLDNDAIGELATGSTTVTKWKDGKAAAKAVTDSTFVGIYAYEMTWSGQYGHMNTFNSTGFVSRNDPQYVVPGGQGLKAYYDLIKQYPQTISQFNHPGSTFGDFENFGYYSPELDKQITLIEVGNGEGAVRTGGYFPSYDYYQRALDKGWHVAPTNNQDNHKGKWGDANTARTVILTDDFSETGIYAAMAEMKVYATEDNNLKINYSINEETLGTIIDQKPNSLDVKVSLADPDETDAIERVSLIADGGVVAATKLVNDNETEWNLTLDPSYSYYYVRVEQKDKDIAVTAPIWIGEVTKIGIGGSKSAATMHVVGEEMDIVTNLFNNEPSNLSVTQIEYVVDDEIVGTQTVQDTITPLTNKNYTFKYTPKRQGKYDVKVKVTATWNGNAYTFNAIVKLDVIKLTDIVNIAIDGAHSNFYVTGNYKDSDLNFISIAGTKNVRVNRILTEISDETLKGMSALVLSTPERHTFDAYVAKNYTAEELAAIKRFADNGGNIILTSTGERLSGYNDKDFSKTLPVEERAATIANNILTAIGATTRFNDDEVVDPAITKSDIYRLAFNTYNYASNSPFLKDIKGVTNENFSFYTGNSISLDPAAVASGTAVKLIMGGPTAKGVKFAGLSTTKLLKPDHITTVPAGEVVALASEKLPGGGFLLASGVTFFSNFEVKVEVDNSTTLQNSNYAIVRNVLDLIKPERPITAIAEVQKAAKYEKFIVQGVVASNASGFDKSTAFFDCIYIQDSTGGINLFPVAGDFKIGDTVKVTGLVGEYQGEKQLTVESIEKIDTAPVVVTPTVMTTKDSMDAVNLGKLIKVSGEIVSITRDNNLVKEIIVNDGTGDSRIFMDGYITATIALADLAVKDNISAVGFSSVDPDGKRLRVRNRAEIIKLAPTPVPVPEPTPTPEPKPEPTPVPTPTPKPVVEKEEPSEVAVKPAPVVNPVVAPKETATVLPVNPFAGNQTFAKLNSSSLILTTVGNELQVSVNSAAIVQALQSIEQNQNRVVVIEPVSQGKDNTLKVNLAGETLKALSASNADVKIGFVGSTIQLDRKLITKLSDQKSLDISIKPAENMETWKPSAKLNKAYTGISLDFEIKNNNQPVALDGMIQLEVALNNSINKDLAGMYYLNTETGALQFVGGRVKGGMISGKTTHNSVYVVLEATPSFKDVTQGNAYEKYVNSVSAKEIVKGFEDGTFKGDQSITRADAAIMIAKLMDYTPAAYNKSVKDVKASHYAAGYIQTIVDRGIMTGYTDGSFKPNDKITRQEMFVILSKLIPSTASTNTAAMTEASGVSEWAKSATANLMTAEVLSGKIAPKEALTRYEAAKLLYNIYNLTSN